MTRSIGRVAYEACVRYLVNSGDFDDGETPVPWDDIPERYKCAWEAAAAAIDPELNGRTRDH